MEQKKKLCYHHDYTFFIFHNAIVIMFKIISKNLFSVSHELVKIQKLVQMWDGYCYKWFCVKHGLIYKIMIKQLKDGQQSIQNQIK